MSPLVSNYDDLWRQLTKIEEYYKEKNMRLHGNQRSNYNIFLLVSSIQSCSVWF